MKYVWSLSALLEGYAVIDNADISVTDITLDSRHVRQGCLFVALKGSVQHGLKFAKSAEEQGAVAVLWESDKDIEFPELSIPMIEVENLRLCLGDIAGRFFASDQSVSSVIGITGTDGKTTVSHFIAEALNDQQSEQAVVIGTLGIGVPGKLQKATHTTPDVISVHKNLASLSVDKHDIVAMEVSSHALDQGRVQGVDFEIAVLTNLTRDHLDYHKTVEAYAEAKAKLFAWDSLQSVVLNFDDAFGRKLAKQLEDSNVQVLVYGIGAADKYPENAIVATRASFGMSGIEANVKTPVGNGVLRAPVLAKFNLSNLLATLGVLLAKGLPLNEALQRIENVRTVPGRMENVSIGDKNVLVVVDYAHTPKALEHALLSLKQHVEAGNNLICVFGCGGDRDQGKRPLMAQIAESYSDKVIVTDDNPRTEKPSVIFEGIMKGFKNKNDVVFEHDREYAIRTAIEQAKPGDVVLIAGKGHEKVQILADSTIPFDDREQARKVLLGMAA